MKDCDWQFENNDLEGIAVWFVLYLTSLAYAAFEARKQIDYFTIIFFNMLLFSVFEGSRSLWLASQVQLYFQMEIGKLDYCYHSVIPVVKE